MLTLPRKRSHTPAQFAQVCAAKPQAVLALGCRMHVDGGATNAWLHERSQSPGLNLANQ